MSKSTTRIVIIGGNAAGLAAASRAKRVNHSASVTVIEQSPHVSYASCGIPYMISEVVQPEEMFALSIDELRQRGLDIWTEHRAEDIDTSHRTVAVLSKVTGREHIFKYDKLILATGASTITPNFNGNDAENVYTIRSHADGLRLHKDVNNHQPQKVAVVGAGSLGLELTEAFRVRGIKVDLIEKAGQILPGVHPEISNLIKQELVAHDVQVYANTTIEGSEKTDNRVQRISLGVTQGPIACDLMVICAGIQPNVTLAQNAKIALGTTGAISVNDRQQTRKLNVFAAGDCAETVHLVSMRPYWSPLAQVALKQGRIAGSNAAGGNQRFPGVVGTQFVKIFGKELATTGLSLNEAQQAGFDADSATAIQSSRARYYPGHQPIVTALIFEKKSGRLLGAQMVGNDGVALRINVLAAALHNGMTLQRIRNLDLGYSPPFAPTEDAILAACSQALKKLQRHIT